MSAGSNTYAYDANGNVTNRSGPMVLWTSYDRPMRIDNGAGTMSYLWYGPDRQLWRQLDHSGGTDETTIYAGDLIEKVTRDGVTTWKHYVEAPTGTTAVYLRRSDGTADTYYLTHDHLGSTDKVLNAAGGVVTVEESFTALGARRGSDWQGTPTPAQMAAIAATTRAGFTGHDMLDSVGLVHMRGRVYDPLIGRFLSVDPLVRDATATQSWNGYGYVEGRALSATDPSGFEYEGLWELVVPGKRCDPYSFQCNVDYEHGFGFDMRTPRYADLLYDPGHFTEPGAAESEASQEAKPLCGSTPKWVDANITAAVATARTLAANATDGSLPPIGSRGVDLVTSARIAPFEQLAANMDWANVAKVGARVAAVANVYNVLSADSLSEGLFAAVDVVVGTALPIAFPLAGVPLSIAYSAHGGSAAFVNDAMFVAGQCRPP